MNISIIGAGNIAYFMATRLFVAGYRIVNIYARKIEEATKLAILTKSKPVDDLEKIDSNVDVFIFALPDRILRDVYTQFPFKEKLLIHCAGSQPIEVFNQGNAGILWPLYSIQKTMSPSERNIPVFWETQGSRARIIIPELASALSDQAQQADLQKRLELHLSAVFVNNFVNHLMTITHERMGALGLPFNECLQPIIEQTIRIALHGESAEKQTGPAIRKDEATIEKHLRLLLEYPEWQELYRTISNSIQKFYT